MSSFNVKLVNWIYLIPLSCLNVLIIWNWSSIEMRSFPIFVFINNNYNNYRINQFSLLILFQFCSKNIQLLSWKYCCLEKNIIINLETSFTINLNENYIITTWLFLDIWKSHSICNNYQMVISKTTFYETINNQTMKQYQQNQ